MLCKKCNNSTHSIDGGSVVKGEYPRPSLIDGRTEQLASTKCWGERDVYAGEQEVSSRKGAMVKQAVTAGQRHWAWAAALKVSDHHNKSLLFWYTVNCCQELCQSVCLMG